MYRASLAVDVAWLCVVHVRSRCVDGVFALQLDFMRQRERRVEDYEQQLQHLRVQDAEEYNMVKIKLETDVQVRVSVVVRVSAVVRVSVVLRVSAVVQE